MTYKIEDIVIALFKKVEIMGDTNVRTLAKGCECDEHLELTPSFLCNPVGWLFFDFETYYVSLRNGKFTGLLMYDLLCLAFLPKDGCSSKVTLSKIVAGMFSPLSLTR
jgi:hypothetical protein